jgi:hypothetical protein
MERFGQHCRGVLALAGGRRAHAPVMKIVDALEGVDIDLEGGVEVTPGVEVRDARGGVGQVHGAQRSCSPSLSSAFSISQSSRSPRRSGAAAA